MVREILFAPRKSADRRVILSNEQLQSYFPEDCTPEMMKKGVLKIMQEWAESHTSGSSNRIRNKDQPDDASEDYANALAGASSDKKGDQKNV